MTPTQTIAARQIFRLELEDRMKGVRPSKANAPLWKAHKSFYKWQSCPTKDNWKRFVKLWSKVV